MRFEQQDNHLLRWASLVVRVADSDCEEVLWCFVFLEGGLSR